MGQSARVNRTTAAQVDLCQRSSHRFTRGRHKPRSRVRAMPITWVNAGHRRTGEQRRTDRSKD